MSMTYSPLFWRLRHPLLTQTYLREVASIQDGAMAMTVLLRSCEGGGKRE